MEIKEIEKMGRHCIDTNMVFFDNWDIPASDLIGEEGNGFKQILHGINAERVLVAAQSVGLGFAALRRAANYASERSVFGRTIGQNQSIQHPLADSWCTLEATRLLIYQAARMYDAGITTGE
jgi:alkylation response protein AidB-like acyl-CoA dehydrogenase